MNNPVLFYRMQQVARGRLNLDRLKSKTVELSDIIATNDVRIVCAYLAVAGLFSVTALRFWLIKKGVRTTLNVLTDEQVYDMLVYYCDSMAFGGAKAINKLLTELHNTPELGLLTANIVRSGSEIVALLRDSSRSLVSHVWSPDRVYTLDQAIFPITDPGTRAVRAEIVIRWLGIDDATASSFCVNHKTNKKLSHVPYCRQGSNILSEWAVEVADEVCSGGASSFDWCFHDALMSFAFMF